MKSWICHCGASERPLAPNLRNMTAGAFSGGKSRQAGKGAARISDCADSQSH
ncbi:MAG: hypothetical protein LBD58_03795 [Treponema sp.]|nr:hypothetical protein [Treponema sp.]